MNLLKYAYEDCVRLINNGAIPDGHGGYIVDWREGNKFKAAFDFNTSLQGKVAEKQGVTGLWNIYTDREERLEFHNVFKRLSDGQIFRVTSKDDKATPKGAGLNLRLISAEEWEL